MSTLRKPALGPIVGHTTHHSCRLWIAASQAQDEEGVAQERRTIGVIGVVRKQGNKEEVDPRSIAYFRLRREYDRSGTFNLGVDISLWADDEAKKKLKPFLLQAATEYHVRMASLSMDDAYPDDANITSEQIAAKLPPPSVWADKLNRDPLEEVYAEATFTTQPAPPKAVPTGSISFLLGSCRYPGLLWKRKESDRIFDPMLREATGTKKGLPPAKQPRSVNFTLMMGDQIYADMFNRMIPIGLADTYEEFQERYHTAFGSRNMRAFLSRVPTYMILDDHEIEDNWTQDRLHDSNGSRILFNLSIGAYMTYQWSHGPRSEDSYLRTLAKGKREFLRRMPTLNLFYDFSCAGYPFFVLDTRTQRFKRTEGTPDDGGLEDNHLLGKPSLHLSEPSQLDRVRAWLKDMQAMRGNAPKFIVSASVFLPNGVDERQVNAKGLGNEKALNSSDSWPAFPQTRSSLLEIIVKNRIENVVFLSGDVHCSSICQMEFTGPGAGLTAYSIVSSAFYWPFSFADGNPAGFVHDSKDLRTPDEFTLPEGLGTMNYRAWSFTQDDNFCRIDVNPDTSELAVQFFDWDGVPIETRKRDDRLTTAPEHLKLAEW